MRGRLRHWIGAILATAILPGAVVVSGASADDLPRMLRQLHSGNAQEAAEAAYWLGEHTGEAGPHVGKLAAILSDTRKVEPAKYRNSKLEVDFTAPDASPGAEAAAALARIGEPAVQTLISVLKTDSSAAARKHAAWALGVIAARRSQPRATSPRAQVSPATSRVTWREQWARFWVVARILFSS